MDKHTISLAQFDTLESSTIEGHLSYRLSHRVNPKHLAIAERLVSAAPRKGNAAIVCKLTEHAVSADYVKSGDDSNGDYLVLVVRNGIQCTIMYTRSKQINPAHLRVNTIKRIEQ